MQTGSFCNVHFICVPLHAQVCSSFLNFLLNFSFSVKFVPVGIIRGSIAPPPQCLTLNDERTFNLLMIKAQASFGLSHRTKLRLPDIVYYIISSVDCASLQPLAETMGRKTNPKKVKWDGLLITLSFKSKVSINQVRRMIKSQHGDVKKGKNPQTAAYILTKKSKAVLG